MTNKILTVECEYCGWSLRYSAPDQIGGDSYHDVRARVCRHERRCEENPLVITIKAIRELLEAADEVPFHDEKSLSNEDMATAIRATYDCFLDVEVEKEKENREKNEN